ncbi:MAG: hypothetical protein R2753_04815 [Chitinophagales bacterium]
MPFDSDSNKVYTTDKKMIYDKNSSFLFFYESYEKIKSDYNSKQIEKVKEWNEKQENENNLRREYLAKNFNYPYNIIYPNELSEINFNIDRYKIFTQLSGMLNTSLDFGNYTVYIYDTEACKKKRIGIQFDGIDFETVVDYVLDFISR